MQTGEVLRRVVFNLLDAAKGGKLKKLKEVNKREIVEGVTPEYMERRIDLLLDYVKKHSPYYKKHPEWTKLEDFPVMTKGDFLEHYEEPGQYELYFLYGTERFPSGNEAWGIPRVDKGEKYHKHVEIFQK